jgi:phage gp16-like protein
MKPTPRLAARRRAVHAACRQLGMDEETRRDMLQAQAGVRSTTKLDMAACEKVLEHLRRVGAARTPKQRHVGQHKDNPQTNRPGAGDLMGKIEAQLADMKLPWSYAESILKRVSADKVAGVPGVEKLEWAKPEHLRKVVAALAYEQEKRGLLAHVDELLAQGGKTRDDLEQELQRRNAPDVKWTRNVRALRQLAMAIPQWWPQCS